MVLKLLELSPKEFPGSIPEGQLIKNAIFLPFKGRYSLLYGNQGFACFGSPLSGFGLD